MTSKIHNIVHQVLDQPVPPRTVRVRTAKMVVGGLEKVPHKVLRSLFRVVAAHAELYEHCWQPLLRRPYVLQHTILLGSGGSGIRRSGSPDLAPSCALLSGSPY